MLLKILADAVLLLHGAFILFALFGGLLVLWKRHALWFHLPAALWAFVISLTTLPCPLTPLENYFRTMAGEAGYGGGFIQHYFFPTSDPESLPMPLAWLSAGSVLILNAAVYGFVAYRKRRKTEDLRSTSDQ
jgi:hypothetical protein